MSKPNDSRSSNWADAKIETPKQKRFVCRHPECEMKFKRNFDRARHEKSRHPLLLQTGVLIQSNTDKLAALAMVRLFNGHLEYVEAISGVSVADLRKWEEELRAGEIPPVEADPRQELAKDLMIFVKTLLGLMLMRINATDFKQLYVVMGIASDKIEALTRRMALSAPSPEKPAPVESPAESKPEEVAIPDASADERARYLNLVDSIMRDAEANKRPMTRDQAIDGLIAQRPDAAKHLRPSSPTIESDSETESVN